MNTFQFGKTVLKLNQNRVENPQKSPVISLSSDVFKAMSKLIDIITLLRLPQGGWPANLPQTPENLLPYVTEEACEVLEVLQIESTQNLTDFSENFSLDQRYSSYIFLEDFIAQLLWDFAKTSETIVRLLSGMPAQILNETNNSTGTLRLVAILAAQNSHQDWQVDLATQQPVSFPSQSLNILPETLIQFQNGVVSRQPLAVSELLEKLWQEIHQFTPELSLFQSPLSASWLKPGADWQMGTLQLKLEVEFTLHSLASESEKVEKNQGFYLKFLDELFSEKCCQTLIKQTLNDLICDSVWQQQIFQDDINKAPALVEPADEMVVENLVPDSSRMPVEPEDELLALETSAISPENAVDSINEMGEGLLSSAPKNENFSNRDEISPDLEKEEESEYLNLEEIKILPLLSDTLTETENLENDPKELLNEALLLKLINLADQLADKIQVNSVNDSIKLQLSPLPLDDVIHRLLWHLIRSRYEIMQLVGGVTAGMMQPNLGWIEGILKLRPTLKTLQQTPAWEIDLTTGQMPSTERLFVLPEAVIYSTALPCLHQPVQAQTLLNQWIEQLSDTIPEVAQWMAGVAVEWEISPQNWQPVTLQLNLSLEFQPS